MSIKTHEPKAAKRVGRTDGLTHREIGDLLGISSARVQQIETVALAKMRREAERSGVDLSVLSDREVR